MVPDAYNAIVLTLLLTAIPLMAATTDLHIDFKKTTGRIVERFWTNTGFSPTPSGNSSITEFLLSKDEELNLLYIGALPNRGITHVRIHWLLELIKADCSTPEFWKFDFEYLDQFIQRMDDLNIGFELMGNPSGCFKKWPQHSHQWISMLRQLTQRYSSGNWRFESFNEPDLRMFNTLNMNWTVYLHYIKSTAKALLFNNLALWGPAGLFKDEKHHPLCWGLLNYCGQANNSANCPVKVISFHKKGDGVASQVVAKGEEFIRIVNEKYPQLKDMSFANDEGDPLSGWIIPVSWRADVRYAAAVVQTVIGSLAGAISQNYTLTSLNNDNGFLSFWPHMWSQRTLLARFQINNTNPAHTQLFRKPVYSAMELLSLLGRELISVSYNPGNPGMSWIATAENKQQRMTVLLTVTYDLLNTTVTNETKFVECKIRIAAAYANITKYKGISFTMDNQLTNPSNIWAGAGSPDYPGKHLRRKIRKHELPKYVDFEGEVTQKDNFITRKLNLMIPSVVMINICTEQVDSPGPVLKLRYFSVTKNEILLRWSDTEVKSRCLRSYIVEFRQEKHQTFSRITRQRFLTTAYHFDGCFSRRRECREGPISGWYRVAAIDMWGRTGTYSNILRVN